MGVNTLSAERMGRLLMISESIDMDELVNDAAERNTEPLKGNQNRSMTPKNE
jgi:hypothetical protein